MTDELTPNTSVDDNQNKELPIGYEADPILKMVARIVRDTGIELGVILFIKGNIITGMVTSPEQYFDGLAKEFEKANGSQEVGQLFAESFRQFRDSYASFRQENQENKLDPEYIHLKNTKFISSVIFNNSYYWRGRINQIDGFSFGSI